MAVRGCDGRASPRSLGASGVPFRRRAGRPLHLRGPARRHRHGVRPRRRDDARRRRRTSSRRRSTPPTGARSCRAVDDPGYIDGAAPRSSTSTTCGLVVPLTDLDHRVLAAQRDAARRARAAPRPGRRSALCEDKYAAHRFFDAHGIADAADLAPGRAARTTSPFPVLVKARRGFGSRHIYRAADRARARLLPRLHDGRVDGAAGLRGRGVLDRRLLRPRRPLPERDPAHDDRVEGRRVDQGHDDQGRAS